MNVLIYGAGAIGCHIGYCMYVTGHRVKLICRGEHYAQMKQQGMHITICDNEAIKHDLVIKEDERFEILTDLDSIQGAEMDCIFITLKLMDYNSETLQALRPFMTKKTAVVPPCTELPFWWFYNLQGNLNGRYKDIDFDPEKSRYFIKTNIICMTMWLSAVLEKPGHVVVKHVQRGYPLEAVYPQMVDKGKAIRAVFDKTCTSPIVEDIRSEIFLKSINSFAFNLVAIDKEFNNLQLSQDPSSKDSISKIMIEGDEILRSLNIPIIQSVQSRIDQTLSSTKHTMSMLHAFQNKKPIELKHQWDSFSGISKVLGLELSYSRIMYEKVMAKVCSRI